MVVGGGSALCGFSTCILCHAGMQHHQREAGVAKPLGLVLQSGRKEFVWSFLLGGHIAQQQGWWFSLEDTFPFQYKLQ